MLKKSLSHDMSSSNMKYSCKTNSCGQINLDLGPEETWKMLKVVVSLYGFRVIGDDV